MYSVPFPSSAPQRITRSHLISAARLCVCTGVSSLVMFVVTGVHTKRRPPIDKSRATIRKQSREGLGLLPAASHLHRRPPPMKPPASSGRAAPHIPRPRMTPSDGDVDARNRHDKGRHPPARVPPRRVAPPRVRKFIPKPLILVERMKALQLVLESSPPVAPASLTCSKTTPPPTHVTPPMRRASARDTLLSGSHSSSSVSFLASLHNNAVCSSCLRMMPRPMTCLSLVTLDERSSSTDTFVADSPCFVKKTSSNVPLLITENETTNVCLDTASDPGKKFVSHAWIPVLLDSVSADFVHWTCQSIDVFEPAMTSTPITSSQANTNGVPSPMKFTTTTVSPTCLPEQALGFAESSQIVSPTSRAVYPFNALNGAYIVKLPNSRPADLLSNWTRPTSPSSTALSHSKLTMTDAPSALFANAHKPAFDLKRLSSRTASPSPTLVLDGVFALPRPTPTPSASPRRTLKRFPRPRKPSCRPLVDKANAQVVASPAQPVSLLSGTTVTATFPTSRSSHGPSGSAGPESPRSKLAHVLTANAQPQTMRRTRQQARVPPLVKGVEVSIDPRTQCEIEGLRMRKVVVLGRGDGAMGGSGDLGDDGGRSGKGAIERMSLARVGIVAKLRARWEMGAAACRG